MNPAQLEVECVPATRINSSPVARKPCFKKHFFIMPSVESDLSVGKLMIASENDQLKRQSGLRFADS
jgi:hypothetical protein